jgi:hypothetical protein
MNKKLLTLILPLLISAKTFSYCVQSDNNYENDKVILEENLSSVSKKDKNELFILFADKHGCKLEAQDDLRSYLKTTDMPTKTEMLIRLAQTSNKIPKLNETINLFIKTLDKKNRASVLKELLQN